MSKKQFGPFRSCEKIVKKSFLLCKINSSRKSLSQQKIFVNEFNGLTIYLFMFLNSVFFVT
jgi:superfamily II RNA helicase